MSDLAEFLLARIAEDEALARDSLRAGLDDYGEEAEWMELQYDHTALSISPRRVLAECEAKRRIVEMARPVTELAPGGSWERTLHFLALPYAGHPDCDEAWRP